MKNKKIDIYMYDENDSYEAYSNLIKLVNGKRKYVKMLDSGDICGHYDFFMFAISDEKFTLKDVKKEAKSGDYIWNENN